MTQKDKLNELQGKLNEIFDGIDDYYSQSIMDELINRIDATIDNFNNDFKQMVGNLNKKPIKKTRTRRASSARKTKVATKTRSTVSKAKTLK